MVIHVGIIGERLPPLPRKDGEAAPTTTPRCQRDDCDGDLEATGRTQGTASAGVLSDLRCTVCRRHSWWREQSAFELVNQDLRF